MGKALGGETHWVGKRIGRAREKKISILPCDFVGNGVKNPKPKHPPPVILWETVLKTVSPSPF